ncbi:Carcinoembryonic antigen-related cell adhesion molecule 20 [Dissostichus eleginoides]|uniref:Carcinoembryonic antigen-related cell adhesion molecule 20 n=1 Tax=Dissostichus eleginoides TaxID=100907 RepID=A0AAD9BA04_DISEL|nr:Carcinoembryonic antigen-related cell adhesion molecule 20 [Dissostichus eleginoides]
MDVLSMTTLLLLLSFLGCCAGQGVLPDGPVDAVLGKSVTLKTLVDIPEYVAISWIHNDGTEATNVATALGDGSFNVNDPYKGRVTMNITNGNLHLEGLLASDNGDYTITIIAQGGTTTGDIHLRVLEPVSDVAITSSLPEAMEHNSTVVLTCAAKGSYLKFAWLMGTKAIVADGKRITLKEEELSSILTITGVLRTDLPTPVTCNATNNLESQKSAPFSLIVHYGPDEVSITPPNPPKFLRSKFNFSLSCASPSSPPATFSWYQNQQLLEVAGPVLTLEAIEKFKLGSAVVEYTCRAKNAKTQREASSPAVSFAVMEAVSGAKVSGPMSVLLAGNSSANLSCGAASGRAQSVRWEQDGAALSPGARRFFSPDMSSMLISPLQKEDNGEFTCMLTNPINTDSASYRMVVNYGPEAALVSGESAVEVDTKVVLTCSAASVPPANFTWKFNGTKTDVKTAQYQIEAARYKNTGMYMCEAHNPVTGKTSNHTHTLSVKEEGALDEGLSDGAIAGIVIAVLIALGAAIALLFFCRQKVPVESPY